MRQPKTSQDIPGQRATLAAANSQQRKRRDNARQQETNKGKARRSTLFCDKESLKWLYTDNQRQALPSDEKD
ncbi:MAG TPA: hypothetical protein DD740_11355 [Chryseobacterium sp.]|nr:hypothetical protein [Chryseobacterium sp.]